MIAERGIEVTACEPDLEMAAVLRDRTSDLPVTVVVSTFEDFPPDQTFDLICSASAWHWTEPSGRWQRTASLLRPGGTFASFGSGGAGSQIADPTVRAAVEEARRSVLPDDDIRLTSERAEGGFWWPGSELVERDDFDSWLRRTRAAGDRRRARLWKRTGESFP